ncbi:MAG: DUF4398 domain-containing protein [Desulfobacterales bacterium]|nr:DUF4398 domain-containing protein [Desulfobacterales bacterium]
MIRAMKKNRYLTIFPIILVSFWLIGSGCAAKIPAPIDKISNVEMAITRARESNANNYAPLDLKLAEEKLAEAKSCMTKEEYKKATIKAEEALLDAQVAEAKARAEKAKKDSKEMQESVDLLRKEIESLQQ